jgi:hypothetical protein
VALRSAFSARLLATRARRREHSHPAAAPSALLKKCRIGSIDERTARPAPSSRSPAFINFVEIALPGGRMRLLSSLASLAHRRCYMISPVAKYPGYPTLRLQGAQPPFDVGALAEEITSRLSGDAPWRILLDWSLVKSWPFEAPSSATVTRWNGLVPRIQRVAIVHAPKWNQHASVLSALLRMSGAEVRSFRLRELSIGASWLEQDRK